MIRQTRADEHPQETPRHSSDLDGARAVAQIGGRRREQRDERHGHLQHFADSHQQLGAKLTLSCFDETQVAAADVQVTSQPLLAYPVRGATDANGLAQTHRLMDRGYRRVRLTTRELRCRGRWHLGVDRQITRDRFRGIARLLDFVVRDSLGLRPTSRPASCGRETVADAAFISSVDHRTLQLVDDDQSIWLFTVANLNPSCS